MSPQGWDETKGSFPIFCFIGHRKASTSGFFRVEMRAKQKKTRSSTRKQRGAGWCCKFHYASSRSSIRSFVGCVKGFHPLLSSLRVFCFAVFMKVVWFFFQECFPWTIIWRLFEFRFGKQVRSELAVITSYGFFFRARFFLLECYHCSRQCFLNKKSGNYGTVGGWRR